jgi:hypothetical protein
MALTNPSGVPTTPTAIARAAKIAEATMTEKCMTKAEADQCFGELEDRGVPSKTATARIFNSRDLKAPHRPKG